MLDNAHINEKEAFGERIQKARKQKGLTQEELSRQLDVNRSTVSLWESGKSFPKHEHRSALCALLECDMSYLFGELDDTFSQAEQTAADYTGLSVEAVRILHKWKAQSCFITATLAAMLESENGEAFENMLSCVARYEYEKAEESQGKNVRKPRKQDPTAPTVAIDAPQKEKASDAALYHAAIAFDHCVRSLKSFVKA